MTYIIVAVVSKIVLVIAGYLYIFLDIPFLALVVFFSGFTCTACALSYVILVVDGDISVLGEGGLTTLGLKCLAQSVHGPSLFRLLQPYLQNSTGNLHFHPVWFCFPVWECLVWIFKRPAITCCVGASSGLGTGILVISYWVFFHIKPYFWVSQSVIYQWRQSQLI